VSSLRTGDHDLVVLGASWGGLRALRTLLGGLSADFAASIVLVQHRSPQSHPTALRELLDAAGPLPVREVDDKEPLEPAHVYIAPPGFHTLVDGDHLELSVEPAVEHSRPSIDVLFETAAEARRERCVGVVLTGANADGAAGLARIVELGGTAIVQDPETAERPEMPAAALQAVPTARVASVEEIALLLVRLCSPSAVWA
jgi:two-component system, chemotaxis family, protein-glutamate methylesterase/glutaminase